VAEVTSSQRILMKVCITYSAIIQDWDWMFPFAAYTAAETPNVFQWAAHKLPLPWGSRPHLIHGSLGHCTSAPQITSWSVQPFLQGSWTRPTHRQTDTHSTDLLLGLEWYVSSHYCFRHSYSHFHSSCNQCRLCARRPPTLKLSHPTWAVSLPVDC